MLHKKGCHILQLVQVSQLIYLCFPCVCVFLQILLYPFNVHLYTLHSHGAKNIIQYAG